MIAIYGLLFGLCFGYISTLYLEKTTLIILALTILISCTIAVDKDEKLEKNGITIETDQKYQKRWLRYRRSKTTEFLLSAPIPSVIIMFLKIYEIF